MVFERGVHFKFKMSSGKKFIIHLELKPYLLPLLLLIILFPGFCARHEIKDEVEFVFLGRHRRVDSKMLQRTVLD